MGVEVGPQVGTEHYDWATYNTKARWVSYWHQVAEVHRAGARNCLEIGLGSGDVRRTLRAHGLDVVSLDVDPALTPDRVGSVTELPCEDSEFDVVLCAQVLEHLPWDRLPAALGELARAAARRVVVSLPQAGPSFRLAVEIPWIVAREVAGRVPSPKANRFDGQHYWEVGRVGTRASRVRAEFAKHMRIEREYVVPENTFHRFYVGDVSV